MGGKSRHVDTEPGQRFNVTVTVGEGRFATTTRVVTVAVAPATLSWFFTTCVRRNATAWVVGVGLPFFAATAGELIVMVETLPNDFTAATNAARAAADAVALLFAKVNLKVLVAGVTAVDESLVAVPPVVVGATTAVGGCTACVGGVTAVSNTACASVEPDLATSTGRGTTSCVSDGSTGAGRFRSDVMVGTLLSAACGVPVTCVTAGDCGSTTDCTTTCCCDTTTEPIVNTAVNTALNSPDSVVVPLTTPVAASRFNPFGNPVTEYVIFAVPFWMKVGS